MDPESRQTTRPLLPRDKNRGPHDLPNLPGARARHQRHGSSPTRGEVDLPKRPPHLLGQPLNMHPAGATGAHGILAVRLASHPNFPRLYPAPHRLLHQLLPRPTLNPPPHTQTRSQRHQLVAGILATVERYSDNPAHTPNPPRIHGRQRVQRLRRALPKCLVLRTRTTPPPQRGHTGQGNFSSSRSYLTLGISFPRSTCRLPRRQPSGSGSAKFPIQPFTTNDEHSTEVLNDNCLPRFHFSLCLAFIR